MSDKQRVLDAVTRMSDTATLQEISEAVAILAAIQRGKTAIENGQVLTHEEVRKSSEAWVTK